MLVVVDVKKSDGSVSRHAAVAQSVYTHVGDSGYTMKRIVALNSWGASNPLLTVSTDNFVLAIPVELTELHKFGPGNVACEVQLASHFLSIMDKRKKECTP
jgi:hypothetical protein